MFSTSQHANKHSRMESRFPLSSSCWFGRHVRNLLPKFQNRCVVASSMQSVCRRLFVAADVASVHLTRSEPHKPAQYPCVGRDFDADAMFQRSLQCSGLADHTSPTARSMIPFGWLSPTGALSRTVWLPSWRACAISPSPVPQSTARCRT